MRQLNNDQTKAINILNELILFSGTGDNVSLAFIQLINLIKIPPEIEKQDFNYARSTIVGALEVIQLEIKNHIK